MNSVYNILIALGVIVAILFTALVLITGKGDAMSGGGGVRTSFKGKATQEDMMSRMTLTFGISFMVIALVVDVIGHHLFTGH